MASPRSPRKSSVKKPAPPSTNDLEQPQKEELFPIVGIGASAGGLEAFTQLLSHLPADTGMGFVVIQHLSPNQKSLLAEILSRITPMPVTEAINLMTVQANHVYVIPPNMIMTMDNRNLLLNPRKRNHLITMTIDIFFQSLAKNIGNKSIGIVLSGGSEDGTKGLEAIKAAGGITFAQTEQPGMINTMPKAAISSGCVDFILTPPQIAEKLVEININNFGNAFGNTFDIIPQTTAEITPKITTETINKINAEIADPLLRIFALLKQTNGVDFTCYKQNTLRRRINRRMKINNITDIKEYALYVENNPVEVKKLFQDLLITVTSFFRDPEAFKILAEKVFPVLLEKRKRDDTIRIWVTGCSTGEEAYSLAISLIEFLSLQSFNIPIQIFATDVNEVLIEKARIGIYNTNQIEGVSPERLARFFTQVEGGYQINKSVRELCIFARQNLITDPPLSRMDLITCRNVLIYLQADIQRKILPILHYSLKSKGFLFLGTSESLGNFQNLFNIEDKKYKIFSRKLLSEEESFQISAPIIPGEYTPITSTISYDFMDSEIYKEADRIVLDQFSPVGVVINDHWDIIQFRGQTNQYLEPAPGKPTFNILKMAKEELRLDLRSSIYEAQRENKITSREDIQIRTKEFVRRVRIDVIPFQIASQKKWLNLILFQEQHPVIISETVTPEIVSDQEITNNTDEIIAGLKKELKNNKEYLQSIIEEQQSTNQDLRAANEEILSSNEELQSTNEELETAKEEIQASNEELNTINDELQRRNLEATQLNNDLQNFLTSINIAILMLGGDLRIRRFTPVAESLFNFIPGDVGRPLSDLKHKLKIENLEAQILQVIKTLNSITQEVEDEDGHWYDLRIRPYRTIDNKIDGVVLVLIDITEIKFSSERIRASRDYAEAIVDTVKQSLVVLDVNLRVISANRYFYETFAMAREKTENKLIYELGHRDWDIPELRLLLEDILSNQTQFENLEVVHDFQQIGHKIMRLNARKLILENQELILLEIDDITQQKQLEQERMQMLERVEAANRAKDEFLSTLSHELRNPLNSLLGWTQLLRYKQLDADRTEQALAAIERSAKAQNMLIGDLLDISRISAGRLDLDIQTVKLIPLISAAIETINLDAERKNIQIHSRLDQAEKVLPADPDRLQQVIWNLLSNAIKFTPSEGRIDVSLNYTDTQAEIQVMDNGIGISAEFLPYIFERFRQQDSSTRKSNQGLGLGLAIVRHLIELHGGTITATSSGEGQGSTFTIRLPLSNNLEESVNNISGADQSKYQEEIDLKNIDPEDITVNNQSLAGVRVLLVDDQVDVRLLFQILLEDSGAEVTVAESAREALSILRENPTDFDVILSDIGMPNEDGYMLMRQIRALSPEEGGQIPAAALTGYSGEAEFAKALAAGFQKQVNKPINQAQLLSVVADLVRGNRE